MPKTYGKWKATGRSVGRGGQSTVKLVEDSTGQMEGVFALKLLRNEDSYKARARFKSEVAATQKVQHPSILKIYDFDLEAKEPYYVAEYCEGESMQKTAGDRFRGNLKETIATISPVVEALVAAHGEKVYHRDVKPSNILFRKDGTPVIGDFGICFMEGGDPLTLSDEAVGSRYYLAPEMEAGNRELGEPTDRTDVYSLGKVLYWMVSGGRVFDRENHRGNALSDIFSEESYEHVHMLLDQMVALRPNARLGSERVMGELKKTVSLVEGKYAPLKTSRPIKCRFCGLGSYENWATVDRMDNRNDRGRIGMLGMTAFQGADIRVLRCGHCGHVELFQMDGVKGREWWGK